MYLKFEDQYFYFKKRKLNTHDMDLLYDNAKFAKHLFEIIDTEKDGGISDTQLANPLISLGLAMDKKFVQKVMSILAPNKFKSLKDFEYKKLSL